MQVIVRDGKVANLVSDPEPEAGEEVVWNVPDGTNIQVGDAFDPRDKMVSDMDTVLLRITYRHENLIRGLIRALRETSNAANNAANAAGLPSSANSADLTEAQYKIGVKALL